MCVHALLLRCYSNIYMGALSQAFALAHGGGSKGARAQGRLRGCARFVMRTITGTLACSVAGIRSRAWRRE